VFYKVWTFDHSVCSIMLCYVCLFCSLTESCSAKKVRIKVPKLEILDLFDYHHFCPIKPLWESDFGAKINIKKFYSENSYFIGDFVSVCAEYVDIVF
jgi:hypothetical protein